MFCPQCGAEFRPGFDRCNSCDVALVHDPPPEVDHHKTPYAMVFATSETDVLPVIKSLLQSAKIPFETDGEAMLNLFPSALLGPVLSRPRGEVRFYVEERRAEEARELLTEYPSDVEPESDGAVESEPDGAVESEPDGAVESEPDGAVESEPDGTVESEPDGGELSS